MDNRTNNNVSMFLFIGIFGTALIDAFGLIGMIIAFVLMTSYMNNFVLKPLSQKLSMKHYTPSNYMYRKLQNTRLVIWIISAMLGFSLVFLFEMIAMAISSAKINKIKRELGMPIDTFSKDDYLIYDEYGKFSEDDEYNEYESEENDNSYTRRREYSYDDVVEEETIVKTEDLEDKEKKLKEEIEAIKNELYKTVSKEPIPKEAPKFDFDKPVGDMPKVEPIKTSTSSIWDEPIGSTSNRVSTTMEEKTEPSEDEIRCEKCGTIMSKMKIACPKCGTLVKNSYRSGK